MCSLCEVISHAGAGEGHLDFFVRMLGGIGLASYRFAGLTFDAIVSRRPTPRFRRELPDSLGRQLEQKLRQKAQARKCNRNYETSC